MLDIVQKSFENTEVDRAEVFRVALVSILFAAGDDLFKFAASHNDSVVQVSPLTFLMGPSLKTC